MGQIGGIWMLFVALAVVAGFLALLGLAAARARRHGISTTARWSTVSGVTL